MANDTLRPAGPHLQRIVIVRALKGLGDFLCLVPALRSLRATAPQAQITLVGLSANRPLVERFSAYLDTLLEFPGYPGLPEQEPALSQIPAFLTQAQAQRFDLALQLHGSGEVTNPLTVLLGASATAGFYRPGHYCPDRTRFLPFADRESEVRRYLRLLNHLGLPATDEELAFPLTAADWRSLAQMPQVTALQPGQYVCIHPGASVAERRWSPADFAQVGDRLASQGFTVVLTGAAAERPLTRQVAAAMQADAVDLAGATDLGALACLLSRAKLLLCNDTGVSHLAAALRLPSVVVFSGSDPQRWAPLDRQRHRVVLAQELGAVRQAIVQAEDLLQRGLAYAS